MIRIYILLLAATFIFAQSNFIKSDNLMKTVEYLASPELEGRLGGSEGYYKAAVFMANNFAELGLAPINSKSYFQKLNVEYNEILSLCSLNLMKGNEVLKSYQLGEDYVFRGFTGSGNLTADVVFVGYGISADSLGYDDYAGVNVKDKIVMAFKYNPKWKIDDKDWPEGNPRPKSKVAAERGAKAILFISFPNDENPQEPIGSVLHGSGIQDEDFPQLHIDLSVAEDLLNGTGFSLSDLQTRIDSTMQPFSIELNKTVHIEVNAKYEKERETVNVAGIYEGSDNELKNEFVIIGAHLDHAGQQGNEIYFPGANDNASGSAAVLEIARAFAKEEITTDRSIIFVLFSNEESGLEGAEFLANNLPVPTEKVVAMLNLDCVAYGDSIRLGNGKSVPKLWELAKEIDNENDKMSVDATWSGGGADATPFHNLGIPSLYFVTTNSYTHLHKLSDKPETLNPELYEKITRLAFNTLLEIADGNYKREEVIK